MASLLRRPAKYREELRWPPPPTLRLPVQPIVFDFCFDVRRQSSKIGAGRRSLRETEELCACAHRASPATRRKDGLLLGPPEGGSRPRRAGLAAVDVAMTTEPEDPVAPSGAEPAVPSLVDRYFTRWYRAGKWGNDVRLPWAPLAL